jgi:hypothetical protein|tara:strand:- start:4632 stop:4970 length:339 start_codon:yes stop_codon:yes gene_type:complete
MASTPEGRIKAKVDKLLKELGVWYYSPQAGPYGTSGIPDRVAIVDGLFVGVECKADAKKKPTALQQKCMRDIELAGGKCFVVCDAESLALLKEFIYARRGKGQGSSLEAEQP